MNTLIYSIIFLTLSFSENKPSCDCNAYQERQVVSYQKGDIKTFLKDKNSFRLKLVNDRIAILDYFANHPEVSKENKAKITSSIWELKEVKFLLEKNLEAIQTVEILSAKSVQVFLNRIQDRSGLALKKSSDLLFGTYHGNEIPPFQVIKPGGGTNCEEGETPPNYDCGSVAQSVNNACLDGIQQKMECGYYADQGNDGEQQLSQDMMECTTAMENSRSACQQAIAACDNSYDPNRDQYDFWRRASLHCSLKELIRDPVQTQTSNGN